MTTADGNAHPRLPLDPDAPDAGTAPTERWRLIGAVAAGGFAGAALRDLAVEALPAAPDRLPWATLLVNLAGAFLLGVLMEVVAERAPAGDPTARVLRHLAGVGLLGAFTTYSTFALETDLSLRAAAPLVALGGGAAAVVLGMVAAAAGIAAGRRLPLPGAWREPG